MEEEQFVVAHKEAILKRKRAEEEIKETYDALFEFKKEQTIASIRQEMRSDQVKSIEVELKPRGASVMSSSDETYIVCFNDGTIVTGNYMNSTFLIGDIRVTLTPCHIRSDYIYKDKRKLPKERINEHLPAMRVFWRRFNELYSSNLKRKTEESINE